MPAATEVSVPDLGDFTDVPVIEIHVAAGDVVSEEDPLITLGVGQGDHGDPLACSRDGAQLRVEIGERVQKGSLILLLDTACVSHSPATADRSAGAAGPGGS